MNVHDMASTMRTDLTGFLGDVERDESAERLRSRKIGRQSPGNLDEGKPGFG